MHNLSRLVRKGDEQAKQLKAFLHSKGFSLNIIGRARKIKIVLDRDHVIETLHVHGREYIYQQVENSFTQPNATMARQMLAWAEDCTRESTGDLLELYCGNGHFSIALARHFRRVLATELAKGSVNAARYNIAANHIENMKIVRLSAVEVTQAIAGVRPFRRLREAGVQLDTYQFGTVLVDPPRAGMDTETCEMVRQFERIVYVSCNPVTLKQNLDQLCTSHRITRFALFDQFPNTDHIECGVLLQRR